MTSKNKTVFEIDNIKYQFDCNTFKNYSSYYVKEHKITLNDLFNNIAQKVNVSPEAVKQWYYNYNGPSELDMIKGIACLLNIGDYLILTRKFEEDKKMSVLTSLQLESLKRIYDSIIDYLDDFYKTDGFTGTLWYKFANSGSENPEQDIYDYAEDKVNEIRLIIQKEYFYLHDTEVYGEICEYADDDLWDIFNGKLSYAYRFEAIPDGNPTTSDDYNKALKRLNEIIEKYV